LSKDNNNNDDNVTPLFNTGTDRAVDDIMSQALEAATPPPLPSWLVTKKSGITQQVDGRISIVSTAYIMLDNENQVIWSCPIDVVEEIVMLDEQYITDDVPLG